jgi:dephospho-CoA kinase
LNLKIGITGNIGAGKSAFASFLKELGFVVLDADSIAKEIMSKNKNIKASIIKEFGDSSFFEDGSININFLRSIVFEEEEKTIKLNSIVHPALKEEINKILQERIKDNDIIFIEAALIYEAKLDDLFDYIICLVADYNLRISRAATKYKVAPENIVSRDKRQFLSEEKAKKSNIVIYNNGSLEELRNKSVFIANLLKLMAKKK